jgi:kinesin family member C1
MPARRHGARACSEPHYLRGWRGLLRSTAHSISSSSRRPIGGAQPRPLQSQLLSLESAHRADAAALATTLSPKRAKVSELQSNHLALSRELAAAKEHEREKEREDAEEVRKRHEREVKEREGEAKKWEEEARQLEGEIKVLKGDLDHQRSTVTALKETLSTQTTSHLTLTTQNTLLTAQITALRSSLSSDATSISGLRDELERARERVKELEEEAREAEGVRRGLHNLVMELKGNIRVFCRVRPVLPSDVPSSPSTSSEPSAANRESGGGVEVAEMKFPDRRDHKEIVLESVGESAMGQERREVYNFGFDRVRRFSLLGRPLTPPPRYTEHRTNEPST